MVEQCARAGVTCFVKQIDLGSRVSKIPEQWEEELRVREWPR